MARRGARRRRRRRARASASRRRRWGRYPLRGAVRRRRARRAADRHRRAPTSPTSSSSRWRRPQPTGDAAHRTARPPRHPPDPPSSGPVSSSPTSAPYVPGDQLRTVNWSVSARRGSLHVTERLTDRAADVVVLVDMSAPAARPGDGGHRAGAARARSRWCRARCATATGPGSSAWAASSPRWLGADIGQRQFYRVLDTVLGAGSDYQTSTGTLAPRAAVPPGAVVVAFSTLLDTGVRAGADRPVPARPRRGGVDVLEGCPLERRAGSDPEPDVGAAAVVDVPRHAGDRRRRGVLAGRPSPSIRRCGWCPSRRIAGRQAAGAMTPGRFVSAAFGLLMAAAAAVDAHGPGLVAAAVAAVAVLAGLYRPAGRDGGGAADRRARSRCPSRPAVRRGVGAVGRHLPGARATRRQRMHAHRPDGDRARRLHRGRPGRDHRAVHGRVVVAAAAGAGGCGGRCAVVVACPLLATSAPATPRTRAERSAHGRVRITGAAPEPAVLLLSTSDTDLITARASGADYRWANPSRLIDGELDRPAGRRRRRGGAHPRRLPGLAGRHRHRGRQRAADGGGQRRAGARRRSDGALDRARRHRRAGPHLPGRRAAWRTCASCTPSSSDTLLMTGFGFAPPAPTPTWGVLRPPTPASTTATARPSRCSTTGPSTWPATPPTSRRCAHAIDDGRRPAAAGVLRVAAHPRTRTAASCSAPPTPWWSPCSPPAAPRPADVRRGRRRRRLGRRTPCRPRRPDPAGAVPDQLAGARGRPTTTG